MSQSSWEIHVTPAGDGVAASLYKDRSLICSGIGDTEGIAILRAAQQLNGQEVPTSDSASSRSGHDE